jgi:hypothetical protein
MLFSKTVGADFHEDMWFSEEWTNEKIMNE